jgi:hypothetical protein
MNVTMNFILCFIRLFTSFTILIQRILPEPNAEMPSLLDFPYCNIALKQPLKLPPATPKPPKYFPHFSPETLKSLRLSWSVWIVKS